MIIKDRAVANLPLASDLVVEVEVLTEDGSPVAPDSVESMRVYRIERGPTADKSSMEPVFEVASPTGRIWEASCQGFASATVSAQGIVEFAVGPDLLGGEDHDFGQDFVVVDGEDVVFDGGRFLVSPTVDGFTISINVSSDFQAGTTFGMAYAKKQVPSEVFAVSAGKLRFAVDPRVYRFWPGTHYAIMEFKVDGERYSTTVEFELLREHTPAGNSQATSAEVKAKMLVKSFPFALFDVENGISGPFGILASYLNEAVSRGSDVIDSLPSMWSVEDGCPTTILPYIAAEMGIELVGTDPTNWRSQLAEIVLRWKSKGSLKCIRERLADCGIELEAFNRYVQVRSRRFKTFATIITKSTPRESLDQDLGGEVLLLQMPASPWVFPSFESGMDQFVPTFAVLEVRAEGSTSWRKIPSTVGGNAILKFRKRSDGAWFAVVCPYAVSEEGGVRHVALVDDQFAISNFSEVRLTYAIEPWGVRAFERSLTASVISHVTRRSGYATLRETSSSEAFFVGAQDGVASCALTKVSNLQDVTASGSPEPRTGFVLAHYAPAKAMMFGGVSDVGRILGDCWVLDFSDASAPTWTKLTTTCPPGRSGASLIEVEHDDGQRRHILFGGWSPAGTLGDCWEWDPTDESWSRYDQPSVRLSAPAFSLEDGPVGETIDIFVDPDGSSLSASQTVVMVDASDRSRGYLVGSVDDVSGSEVIITFTAAGGDFTDPAAVSAVGLWKISWASPKFVPTRLSQFEVSSGPAGESLADVEASGSPGDLESGDERWIADPSSLKRGMLKISVTSSASDSLSFDIVEATGDYVVYDNVSAVTEWIIVDYYGVQIDPSTSGIRPGHSLKFSDIEGLGVDLRATVIGKTDDSVSFEITKCNASDQIYPSDGFYAVDVENLTPPARAGASTCSYEVDGAVDLRAVMFGGVGSFGKMLSDAWLFDSVKGWLPVAGLSGGPVGYCSTVVRTSAVGTVFVGNASCDVSSSGDPGLRVDGPSGWFRLDGINRADPDDVNVDSSANWTPVPCSLGAKCSTWVSAGFDDEHGNAEFFVAVDPSSETTPPRRNSTIVFSGALSWASATAVLGPSSLEAHRPVVAVKVVDASDSPSSSHEVHVNDDVLNVTGRTAYDSISFAPASGSAKIIGSNGDVFWDITPDVVLTLTKAVWTPMASSGQGVSLPHGVMFTAPSSDVFQATAEVASFCPMVLVGDRCLLAGRILDKDRKILGYLKVDEAGTATHTLGEKVVEGPSGILRSTRPPMTPFSYADGVVSGVIYDPSMIPLLVDFYSAAKVDDVAPIIGSYARVRDDWYRLVAVPEGRMPTMTLTSVDGDAFKLNSTDFAVAFSPRTGQVRMWLSSAEPPSLSGIVSAEVDGYFPFDEVVLPPCSSKNSTMLTVGDPSSFVGVLAWSRWWPEALIQEPDVLWGDPAWDESRLAFVMEAEEINDEFSWRVTARRRSGDEKIIPMSQVMLRKVLRRQESDSLVEVSLADHRVIARGDVVEVSYPTRAFAKIAPLGRASGLSGDDLALIGSDHRGASSLSRIASVVKGQTSTTISLKHGAVRSVGIGSGARVGSFIVADVVVDVDNEGLENRPFQCADSYHAPMDSAWKIDGEALWSSSRLRRIVAKTSSGLVGCAAVADVPMFSVPSLVVVADGASGSPWTPGSVVRFGTTTSTMPGSLAPSDLLRSAVTQETLPDMTDSRFITEDWLELFTLSLPRMDGRTVDTLETYRIWRKSVSSGESPTVFPSPPVNHETRLIERDHPFLADLCPTMAPSMPPIVFGMVRTQAPYGSTVFNSEEFDGSTKPSTDPCDADALFVDDCSCSPASHVSWSVKIPVDSNISRMDVDKIMEGILPAHAVSINQRYAFSHDEMVSRCADDIEMKMDVNLDETTLTFNPRVDADGILIKKPLWDQLISNDYPPFADVSVQVDPLEDDLWLLSASGMGSTRIPFSSLDEDLLPSVGSVEHRAFVLTSDDSIMLTGVRRYGESSLLLRENVGGSPPSSAKYSVWNASMTYVVDAEAEVVDDSGWIAVQSSAISGIEVAVGSTLVFRFAPDSGSVSDGDFVEYRAEILEVASSGPDVWLKMNVADVSTDMPLLVDPEGRPGLIMISSGGSITTSSCSLLHEGQVIDENYIRGTIVVSKSIPMIDYDTPSMEIVFDLKQSILKKCLVLCQADLDAAPVLGDAGDDPYDPDGVGSLAVGSIVDGFGSVTTAGGDRVCDFVLVGGRVKAKMSPSIGASITSASFDGSEIHFEFTASISKASVTSFCFVRGTGNPITDARVRSTAVLLPRSRDPRLDVGLRYAAFICGDYPRVGWVPQTDYTVRKTTTVRVSHAAVQGSDMKVGDHVFVGSSPSNHWEVHAVDKLNSFVEFVAYDATSPPSGTVEVFGARLAFESSIPGSFVSVTKSVVVDVDVLASMPVDHASYDDVAAYSVLVVGDSTYDILGASEGPDPGTTTLRLHRPAPSDDVPGSGRFVAWDIDENVETKVDLQGGSQILCEVYVDDVLTEKQEFN